MRTIASLLAASAFAVAPLLPATSLHAQLRFTPVIGLYAPASDFGEVDDAGGAVEFGKMNSTLAFGLHLDLGAQDASRFRLAGVYGSKADIPIGGVGCGDCDGRAEVFLASGALLLRPLPWLGIFQPYGVIGAGAKWYSFDVSGVGDLVDDQAHFMGQAGLGIAIGAPRGSLRLLIEVNDNISGFEFADGGDGDLQHDFLVVVGVTLGG